MLSITINLLLAIHVIVSVLIILVVLMQRPKNEGLGAAFGGGMTENLFGAQTTNVLATFTRWLRGIFFLLSLTLSVLYARQSHQDTAIKKRLLSAPVPAAAASPVPGAMPSPSPQTAKPPALENEMAPASKSPAPAEAAPAKATPAPPAPAEAP